LDANPDADPDLTYHPDADQGYDFLFDPDPDVDPDPIFHTDADPDPDPSFKKAQTLEKVLNSLIFHTFWLDICKLMRIRIFVLCRCGSGCGSRLPK
jgi:hypothetical protein